MQIKYSSHFLKALRFSNGPNPYIFHTLQRIITSHQKKKARRANSRKLHRHNNITRPKQYGININNLTTCSTTTLKERQHNGDIHISLWNCRSACNKTNDIHELIIDTNIDILCLTETWIKENADESIIKALTPDSYICKSYPRLNRKGGGLAIVFRNSLEKCITFKPLTNYDFKCFEACHFQMRSCKNVINVIVLYRPPDNFKFDYNIFIKELNVLLFDMLKTESPLLILGDFNVHWNNTTDPNTRKLISTFKSHNLTQHVYTPTNNKSGNVLDYIISNAKANVYSINVFNSLLSDHNVISFRTNFVKPKLEKVIVTSRNYKKINKLSFTSDIKLSLERIHSAQTLDQQLRHVLDKHAPLATRTVTKRKCQWFNSSIMEARRKKRQQERRWRKTGLEVHKIMFVNSRKLLNTTKDKSKQEYYISKLDKSKTNVKDFYTVLNDITGKQSNSQIPDYSSNLETVANDFVQYYSDKVEKIQENLKGIPLFLNKTAFDGSKMTKFQPVTNDIVRKIILETASKSCELDPMPTPLLKEHLDDLLHVITCIVNDSVTTGTVPDIYKLAIVRPLLKKDNLDINILNNYRPVSNLSFISKIIEKIVLIQILSHLKTNNLFEKFQSAYRQHHSTETALLKTMNDLLTFVDKNSVCILSLLDASAAFDCVNHHVLLDRLEKTYGISGSALMWMESYLTERQMKVCIRGSYSMSVTLKYGVPQGSCLGPILYTLYTQPLFDLINDCGLYYHAYADDIQLYCDTPLNLLENLKTKIESSVQSVRSWMDNNRLKLNEDKTECLVISKPFKKQSKISNNLISSIQFTFGTSNVNSVDKCRNLGVIFDNHLTMEHQVNKLIKELNFQIRKIRNVRRFINFDGAKKMAVNFILSKLDYCNSLLYGVNEEYLDRLQIVMNNAARVVLRRKRCDSATEMLRELHWLPVRARIQYKIATICFSYFDDTIPPYLKDCLQLYTPTRALRSGSDTRIFVIPKTKLKSFGDRAFQNSGPTTWNSLPFELRHENKKTSFKKDLKTYLFNKCL